MNQPFTSPKPKRNRTASLATALTVGGGIAALLWIVVGVLAIRRAAINGDPRIDAFAILAIVAFVLLGLAVGGALIGLAVVLRVMVRLHSAAQRLELHQRELGQAIAENEKIPEPVADPGHDTLAYRTEAGPQAPWQEILQLLQEIREVSLLPEEARRERLARLAEDDFGKVQAQIRYFVAEGDFTQAHQAATEIAARRPDDSRASGLPAQVEASRRQREASDVAAVTREVNDLISMSAWPQARQKARELQEQHPDNIEARHLMVRIEGEYRQAEEEQRRRMYAEVQRFVTRKRWEEALAAANTFIERFAGSDDAEAVRLQVPTLEMNAEIEVRQRLEAEIMGLAKHGRYIEATALAKRVIAQFPDSPQADVLRAQIGRLEELASNPDAPPARVRIE